MKTIQRETRAFVTVRFTKAEAAFIREHLAGDYLVEYGELKTLHWSTPPEVIILCAAVLERTCSLLPAGCPLNRKLTELFDWASAHTNTSL